MVQSATVRPLLESDVGVSVPRLGVEGTVEAKVVPVDLNAFDVRRFGASPTATAAVNNAAFYAAMAAAGRRPIYVGERYVVSLVFADQHVNINCYGGGVLVQELGTRALDITHNPGAAIPVTVNGAVVFGPNLPGTAGDTQVFSTFTLRGSSSYVGFQGGDVYHLESRDAYAFAPYDSTLTDAQNVNVWKAEFVPILGLGIDIDAATSGAAEGATIVGATSGASAQLDSVIAVSDPAGRRRAIVRKITKDFAPGETLKVGSATVGTVGGVYLVMHGQVSGQYATAPNLRKVRTDLVTKLDIVTDIPTGQDSNAFVGTALRTASRQVYLHGLVGAEVTARVKNGWTRAVVAQSCYLGSYNVTCDGLPNHATETEMSYGYAFEAHGASSDFTVTLNATRVRHGYTTNSSPATYALGQVLQFGTPKRITITGTVTRAFSNAFDTHAGAEDQRFVNCYAFNPVSGSRYLSTPNGFNDRSFGTTFINCTADGALNGFTLGGVAYGNDLPYTTTLINCTARNFMRYGVVTSTTAAPTGAPVRIEIIDCSMSGDARPVNTPYYHHAYRMDAAVTLVMRNNRCDRFNGAPIFLRNAISAVIDGHRSDYSAFTTSTTGVRVEGTIGKLTVNDYGVIGGTATFPAAALRNVDGSTVFELSGKVGALDGPSMPAVQITGGTPTVNWRDKASRVEIRTNANATHVIGTSAPVQVYSFAFTNARTYTLPTGPHIANGEAVRVVRTAAATGALALTVNGIKTIEIGTWADFVYDGTAWFVAAAGSL